MKSENIISSAMFSAVHLFPKRRGLPLLRQWQAASPLWQKRMNVSKISSLTVKQACSFEKNEDLPELLYRVLTDKALSEKLSTASIQAMDVLSVQNFADSVEQLYQNILEQEERPKPIAAPVIPFVIGAKAAKGITGCPGRFPVPI